MSILPFARTAALALACVCLTFGSAAAQTLNKSSLSLGNVAIGSTSVAKTVTLKNTRSVPLSIASITASNGFVVAAGTTCPVSPATLAAGASCVIAAAFAPTALGAASGAVTITHSAPSSPQTVALTGTGIEPVVVSPTTLVFSNTVAGAVSATKNVAITNKLNTPLAFTSIVVSPSHFGIASTTCGATLAVGANCVVVVRFQPSAIGALTGSLTVTHSAVTSPHVVSLSGTATPPLTSSTNGLTFAAQGVGTTSAAQVVTLRNRTTASLTVGPSSASGDFAVSATTCGVLAANATCTLSVRFSPTALGARAGTLTIPYSTAPGSPVTVALAGQGDASSVQSIVVTPVDQSIVEGDSLAFTATGTFPGGAQADISTSVVWASADTSVVTISNTSGSHGVATALTSGSSIISATFGAVSGSTLLNVTPLRQLLSIEITPADRTVLRGNSLQLTATGQYSDETSEDLTTAVVWSSSSPLVASVSNTVGSKGLVSALGAGSTEIGATLGAIDGTTGLNVHSPFSTTGSLSIGRELPLSVVLNDGRVLVAGGSPNLATAELYDVASRTFQMAGPRTLQTWYATATLLPSGKVLLAGGSSTGGRIRGAELFDPATNTFSSTGSMGQAREHHTATRLLDGRVLIVGGSGSAGVLASAELYDPATGVFASTGSLATARGLHAAALLPDGRVLIAGGSGFAGHLGSAEVYNPATGTFAPTGTMVAPRSWATAVPLDDGRVLIVGGSSAATAVAQAELYDPIAGTFVPTGSLLTPRLEHAAVALTNGDVLIVGGWSGEYLTNAELYSLATGTFQPAGNMSEPRGSASLALLGDGTVLIVGGTNDSPTAPLNTAELFAPASLEPDGLESISVTPAEPSMAPGAVLRLNATGTFTGGSTRTLAAAIWSSSNPAVATVSNDPDSRGTVTALAAGESEITATVGGFSGATTVTVQTPLGVSEISPPDGLTGVARSTAITVTFNSAISAATLTTNTADTSCTGSLQLSADDFATCVQMSSAPSHVGGYQYSVQPANTLLAGTTYKVRVTTALQNSAGQALPTTFTSTGFTTDSPTLVSLTLSPDTIDHALALFAPFPQLMATATFSDGSTSDVTAGVTWSLTPAHVGVVDEFVPGMLRIGGTGTAVVTATLGAATGTASLVSTSPAPTVVDGHLVTGLTHLRRDSMTVTKLPDGRVLIAGGLNDVTGTTSSAELFDPATDTLTITAPMSVVRQNHTATLLADGRVLVAGGYGGELLSSAEIFNPATGAWTLVAPMNMGRTGHVAVRVGTKVLVAGGDWSGGTSAELFDPATGTWTPTGSLNVGSTEGAAVVLPDGRVLLAGGLDPFNHRFPGEVYNPASGQWTLTGNLDNGRSAHTLTLLASGKALITGGFGELGTSTSAEIYDSATNTWSPTGDLPGPLFEHSATLLQSGQVLLAGLNNETLYDPATGTFSAGAPLRTTRFKHAALRLDDGRVMLVGGVNEPATIEVRTPPPPPEPDLAVLAVQPADGTTAPRLPTVVLTFDRSIALSSLSVNSADTTCWAALQVSADNFATCVRMMLVSESGPNQYSAHFRDELLPGAVYQIRVAGVQDAAGATLATPFISSFTTNTATLVSIAVTPPTSTIGLGTIRDLLTATATYSNGATVDATAAATWTGESTAHGWVGDAGQVISLATGPNLVSATLGGFSASATVSGVGLASNRSQFTATRLADGRVLLAGGLIGTPTATAEIFDPATGLFTATGSMAVARYQHTATLLPDGRVLVIGGTASSFNPTTSTEIYDPATGEWTAGSPMLAGRREHTATLVGTQVWVFYGRTFGNNTIDVPEIFDVASGTWSFRPGIFGGRYGHTATLLSGGIVMLAGGLNQFGALIDVKRYDTALGNDLGSNPMAVARAYHTATVLADGRVLITGGETDLTGVAKTATAELYDPAINFWMQAGSLPVPLSHHTATPLSTGFVLIAGGDSWGTTAALFDRYSEQFFLARPLAYPRQNHAATLLTDGSILIASDGTAELRQPDTAMSSLSLGPATQTIVLSEQADLDAIGTFFDGGQAEISNVVEWGVAPFEGGVVSAGTFHSTGVGTVSVTAGSLGVLPASAQIHVTQVPTTMVNGRLHTGLTHVRRDGFTSTMLPDGRVLVLGGYNGGGLGVTRTAEIFDPSTGEFTPTTPMTAARFGHTATLLPDGRVLVLGGTDATGSIVGVSEVFNPATATWSTVAGMAAPRSRHTATLVGNTVVVLYGLVFGSATDVPEIYDIATDTWSFGAQMFVPRYGHTATLLQDNTILVAGGYQSGTPVLNWKRFDPATAMVMADGQMKVAHGDHTATLLPDGRVLVAGGEKSSGLTTDEAELFDPANNQWTLTGNLPASSKRHTATLLPSGSVLVAGGFGDARSTALYDAAAGAFSVATSLLDQRVTHTATLLTDGSVLLVGGGSSPHTAEVQPQAATIISLDVAPVSTNVQLGSVTSYTATATFSDGTTADVTSVVTWSVTPGAVAFSQGSGQMLATGVGNAVVAATSGAIEGLALLNVQQEGASTVNGFPVTGLTHARMYGHTATRLQDGRVLITGGHDGAAVTSAAELYDPSSGAFSALDSMAVARSEHTATLLPDGRVLVVGGFGSDNIAVASAELFDPATETWTPSAAPLAQRARHTATLIGDTVLVLYGQTGIGTVIDVPETYHVATNTWTFGSQMFGGRWGHTATLLPDGVVLVAGGYGEFGQAMQDVKRYDPVTGNDQGANQMLSPRAYHTATLLENNRVLVTGGDTALNSYTASAELYVAAVNMWVELRDLPHPAYQHTAAVLATGHVLFNGGPAVGGTAASVYDKDRATFDSVPSALGRQRHTATVLDDGSVLLVGGLWSPALAEVRTPELTINALEVTPGDVTVGQGQTAAFQATATFSDGIPRDVTNVVSWKVLPTEIAAATATPGAFRATAAGFATVTATAGNVSASADLTVGAAFGVAGVQPADGLTGVPRDTAIDVTFNVPIDAATLTVNTGGPSSCTGQSLQVSFDDFATCVRMSGPPAEVATNTYRVQPAVMLVGLTAYKVRVTTALQDSTGQSMSTTFTSAGFMTEGPGVVSLTLSPDTITHTLSGLFPFPMLTATATFTDGTTANVTASVTWNVTPADMGAINEFTPGQLHIAGTGTAVVTAALGAATATTSIVSTSPASTVTNGQLVIGLTHTRPNFTTLSKLGDGRVLIAGGYDDVTRATSSAELFDPVSNTLAATPPMSVNRGLHTATRLADGRVLVAGGLDGEALKSAEIFDPATGEWTPVADMNLARYGHVAVLLGTKVLVAGGDADFDGYVGRSAEIFDPATGEWTLTGSLNVGSRMSTAVVLLDGRVLLAGGLDPFNQRATAEVYDPLSEVWTLTGNQVERRYSHTLTLLPSGNVLMTGGLTPSAGQVGTAEIFNSATGTWSATGSMPSPKSDHSATLLASGKVLIVGFFDAFHYDPATGVFSVATPPATIRAFHRAILLDDGRVMLVGGLGHPATVEVRTVP